MTPARSIRDRWAEVLQADCPQCGAGPGEPCKRQRHGQGHHPERYSALITRQPITDQEEATLP